MEYILSSMPKHGEIRNIRISKQEGSAPIASQKDLAGMVLIKPGTLEDSACEWYCDTCKEWYREEGILWRLLGCPQCGREW
jgi:hypothetical protein